MRSLYAAIDPITRRIPAARQQDKRHYGVHPYFTRRPANVVRDYIRHYSMSGDLVVDPFGGSGVTAIEAMLLNRHGIQNDINPLANFIASETARVSHDDVWYIKDARSQIEASCKAAVDAVPSLTIAELRGALARAKLPQNIRLPGSSDVERYYDLFTPQQLLALALIKQGIDEVPDADARCALLLAWSATLGKLNKTFLSAEGRLESRGGSSIFSIYRYKIADRPVELPAWSIFRDRLTNVIEGKQEALRLRQVQERSACGWSGSFEARNSDIAELADALVGSVDYIFTDPPYGGNIAYLDLSVLWNHWLGFEVPRSIREKEIIIGGELKLSEEYYVRRLRESIRLCARMLKPNRWLSVVFQHWNIRYFEAILEEAGASGCALRAAVTQVGDTIWSMHKKKNKEKVLAGEVILTFLHDGKGRLPKRSPSSSPDVEEIVDSALAEVSPEGRPFVGEVLFNRTILLAWSRGALDALDLTRDDFLQLLARKGWRYNVVRHQWFNTSDHVAEGLRLTF
jgi:16S rRNA G966 N2-methylase RsmD